VRFEKPARIEVRQAALESLVFFVGFHRPPVRFTLEFRGCLPS